MGKRSEMEDAAIRLYAEGMEIPRISAEIGVSENSLRTWKKRAGTEWNEARVACRKGFVGSMEKVGARLHRADELAGQLTGNAKTQGKLGLSLNQALQTMIYDLFDQIQTTGIDAEQMPATIDQIKALALTLQRTEAAASLNLKREAEIRRNALEQAAKVITTTAKKGGLTDEAANEIRKKILGIGA